MIKNFLGLALLPVLVNFCGYTVSGQDIMQISYPVEHAAALQKENYNNSYLKPAVLIIPGTLLVYGALKPVVKGIQQLDDDILARVKKNYPHFHTHTDNYLMWAPSASVYIMDAFKVNTTHRFQQHLLLDAGSIIVTGGIGYVMRKVSGNIKEYKTHNTKFPSGHVANAFRAAEFLHQELKDDHTLLSYSGYLAATAVGVLRIYNKVHLLTEVLAGAGLGVLSTKFTYWIFDKAKFLKKK